MPGRIFISCGQATSAERRVAGEVSNWLKTKGFQPYVAIQTQSILDVNSGIISNLKIADYYIFIDFRREKIRRKYIFGPKVYRGSLFTNQELALAYFLNIDQAIFLQQFQILLEGIGKYTLSNALKFDKADEVLPLIQNEVTNRNWSPDYSRHLVANSISFSRIPVLFGDHTAPQGRPSFTCLVGIQNRRNDQAAIKATARLVEITDQVSVIRSPDRTDLKWAGQPGFERTIRPNDEENIDCFSIHAQKQTEVYLHSAADVHPRNPIINSIGQYILDYEVYSQEFSLLTFQLRLELTGNINTTTVDLVQ
jgi:hypothetical protein